MMHIENAYGPALPHNAIYKKLKPFRTGIERTFGLVKENTYRMEMSNFYKGIVMLPKSGHHGSMSS